MENTQNLMDKLVTAVSYKFKTDKTAPGITVARLKHGYYCSVIRYNQAFAKGKEVVCKAKAESLDKALIAVAEEFLLQSQVVKDPVQELDELVRHSK